MVLFEFTIPRIGKRADVVLVLHNKIIILEFKVGAILFDRGGIEQVHDYALDLKNFHSGGHDALIVPVLVATLAPEIPPQRLVWERDNVSEPLLANERNLGDLLLTIDANSPGPSIVPYKWLGAGYRPTPTIIEAAQALYQKHRIEEITRSDAGAKNLNSTTDLVQTIIEYAKASNRKAICFVDRGSRRRKDPGGPQHRDQTRRDARGRARGLSIWKRPPGGGASRSSGPGQGKSRGRVPQRCTPRSLELRSKYPPLSRCFAARFERSHRTCRSIR